LPPEQYAWLRQARTEYTAAALTGQLLHWLIVLGLSPETLQRGSRVVGDEVEHARLSHELYLLCGGADEAWVLNPALLWHSDDPEAPISHRALTAAGQLAVEESIALPVFAARLRNAKHPRAREVNERIHRDEAFHRAFAWDVLDEITGIMGVDTARSWVRPRLAWWMRVYLRASLRDSEPTWTAQQLGMGLIDRVEHWTLMKACIEEVVIPRFVKRGLLEKGVTGSDLLGELRVEGTEEVPPWRQVR
jgi:hypothetical protein